MASILIFGVDDKLLETRKWLLEAQHHRVFTATSLNEFPPPAIHIDLLVLCHTLTKEACDLALDKASRSWPLATHLNLIGIGGTPCSHNGPIFSALDGPAGFISTIRQLLPHPLPQQA